MQSASQPSQPQRKGQEQPEEQKPVNIFANFHLRRIVKENHGQPIYRCCYNKYPSMMSGIAFLEEIDTSNIYATLSEQQVNFYDNEHCGDHLDIISQFTVKPKPGRSPKSPFKLVTCTWVRREFETVLAVGDSDGCIRLLSLAMSKETDCIDTNSDVTTTPISIVELHAHPIDSELLFSLMSDSTVQLWHLSARRCLCIFKTNATVMDVHSKGYAFVTGAADGSLAEWTIPSSVHALDKKAATKFTPIQSEDHKVHEVSLDAGTATIKYMGHLVFSRSKHNSVLVWCPKSYKLRSTLDVLLRRAGLKSFEQIIHQFMMKECGDHNCHVDISPDQEYVAAGSTDGAVYIYDLTTGTCAAELHHKRSTRAVWCCSFSKNGRSLMYTGDDSLIWRYDYIPDSTLKSWAQGMAEIESTVKAQAIKEAKEAKDAKAAGMATTGP